MEIIERQPAREGGLVRYYTGKQCVGRHFSERYVSTGNCIQCMKYSLGADRYKKQQQKNNQTEHRKRWMAEYMRRYRAKKRKS